jgi:uncharacterized protein involved in exopolysaccharide biosynthesis
VYGEVVKNLELAKFTLSQETPVIQIVDRDEYPLKRTKASKLQLLLFGVFLLGISMVGYLIVHRIVKLNVA